VVYTTATCLSHSLCIWGVECYTWKLTGILQPHKAKKASNEFVLNPTVIADLVFLFYTFRPFYKVILYNCATCQHGLFLEDQEIALVK